MANCAYCFLDLTVNPPLEGGDCPNCGQHSSSPPKVHRIQVATPSDVDRTFHSFSSFIKTIKEITFNPKAFFESHAASIVRPGGVSTALAFAVIILWLAAFFNFLWRAFAGAFVESRVNDLFQIAGDVVMEGGPHSGFKGFGNQVSEFLFGAGMMVLTPFTAILNLAILAVFIHAAVRFFIRENSDRPHGYTTTLKILAFASAPWMLCIIPGVGMLLAWILSFFATVIGFQTVYKTSAARATVVVTFPYLLIFGFFAVLLFILLFLGLNMLTLVA